MDPRRFNNHFGNPAPRGNVNKLEGASELQRQVVKALMNSKAYREKTGKIEFAQTHISFIFSTRNFVYKIKKAIDLGFLDFTTLEKRRFFCKKELALNKRLCGDMYIEVVPINKSEVIKIRGKGETIEYAVKMKRMPQDRIMSRLLRENKVDGDLVDKIASIIAKFHFRAKTNREIGEFGSAKTIEANWKENFEQTRMYVGKTISSKSYKTIRRKVDNFIELNSRLFEKRVMEDRVRDCHGDIHSGNIFIVDRIYIFDAIEFNERFRYSDIASDIAFLAMDLDFEEKSDLSNLFVERYINYSGDQELLSLLPFYKCYRAYVRGKVQSLKYDDPSVGGEEKRRALKDARAYFELSHKYTKLL